MRKAAFGSMVLLAVFVLSRPGTSFAEPGYFADRERGWFWYEKDASGSGKKPRGTEKKTTAEDVRRRGEELFERAVLFPTAENVRTYMEHQKRVFERSEEFARTWKRVLLETPSLDATVENPVSAAGAGIARGLRREAADSMLRKISQTGKLVFFFRSDCPFCGAQAEVLATLEKRHGIGVVAASLDGRGLPPLYPRFVNGAAQAGRLRVDAVPAIFLFVPSRRKVARIGAGFLTLGETRERLRLVGEEIFGPERAPGGARELLSAAEAGP